MHPARDKTAWRRRVRAERRARAAARGASIERVALARSLAEHVLSGLPAQANVVAAYRSLPTEPPTTVLLHELVRRGVRVLVPDLLDDLDLDWRALRANARPGRPRGVEAIAAADVVLVPALAVDRSGTRLGQGGGSYDRALARVRPGVPVVALLYDDELRRSDQLPDDEPRYDDGPLPREDHDAPVTAVVTPTAGWTVLASPSSHHRAEPRPHHPPRPQQRAQPAPQQPQQPAPQQPA